MSSFSKHKSVTKMISKLQWQTLQEDVLYRGTGFCPSSERVRSSNILLPPTYISQGNHKDKVRDIRAHLVNSHYILYLVYNLILHCLVFQFFVYIGMYLRNTAHCRHLHISVTHQSVLRTKKLSFIYTSIIFQLHYL